MDRNEQSAPFLPSFPGIIAAASNSKCKNPPLLIFHAVTAAVGAPASMCGLLQRERERREGGAYVAASRPSCKCGLGPRLVEGRKGGRGSSSDGADSI